MTKAANTNKKKREPATYEIRLQGHLDTRWVTQLAVASLAHESDGTTVMHLVVADQSALHGLLQRIRDLGLMLIAVTRIDPENKPEGSTGLPFHQPTQPKDLK
jgi:hypothetical protein